MSFLGRSVSLFAEQAEEKVDALAWSPDLALFTLFLFIVFIVVLSFFAWKPIMNALDDREKSVTEKIDATEANLAKMESLKGEYEAKLAAAAEEASRLVAEAKKDANDLKTLEKYLRIRYQHFTDELVPLSSGLQVVHNVPKG